MAPTTLRENSLRFTTVSSSAVNDYWIGGKGALADLNVATIVVSFPEQSVQGSDATLCSQGDSETHHLS